MISFICKNIVLEHGKQAITYLPTQRFLRNPSILWQSLVYISTDVASQQKSITVSYFINSLGFSPESALSASKYVNFKTLDKPNSVINFFESHGFSKTQIKKVTKMLPNVLNSKLDQTLLPKIEFFRSKGMLASDIAKMFTLNPGIFHRSLECQIIPVFDLLSNLLQSEDIVVYSIRRSPGIFNSTVESLASHIELLRENSVSESNIRFLLHYWLNVVVGNLDTFKEVISRLNEMGISPLKTQFVVAFIAFRSMGKPKWDRKVELYKQWGWSEEEIMTAFCKFPWFMIASEEKIMASMDFFVNEMGWDYSLIAKRPLLITLSLKKRLIPRAAVFKLLISRGALKKEHSKLSNYFEWPEQRFLKDFVNSYDEATELLKIYREKLDSLS